MSQMNQDPLLRAVGRLGAFVRRAPGRRGGAWGGTTTASLGLAALGFVVVPVALPSTAPGFLASGFARGGEAVIGIAERLAPEVVFTVPVEERVVALTIDDGPSDETPEILRVLGDHGAGATFFVLGSAVASRPELARAIVAAGHELGHHMMDDRPSVRLTEEAFAVEFDAAHAILGRFGGSTVFRPGSGWFDGPMVQFAAEHGYRTVLGSVHPFDAHLFAGDLAARYLVEAARPGAILVLHEAEGRGVRAAEVLRTVLPELAEMGYRVVPVSELLAIGGEEPSSGSGPGREPAD